MIKYSILTIYLFLSFGLHSQTRCDSVNMRNEKFILDTNDYVVLTLEKDVLTKGSKNNQLLLSDISQLSKLLVEATIQFNKDVESKKYIKNVLYDNTPVCDKIINLYDYKFQFISLIDKSNKKLVKIICSCKDYYNRTVDNRVRFKKMAVLPEGDGKCFFQIDVDWNNKKVIELNVNNGY